MHELLPNQFAPTNEAGANPITTQQGEILVWKYKPSVSSDTFMGDFIVGKPAGMGDQYIFGPEPAVRAVTKGLGILDSMGFYKARGVQIIIHPYKFTDVTDIQFEQEDRLISNICDQFGVTKNTGLKKNGINFSSGIRYFGERPLVTIGNIFNWSGIPSERIVPVLFAARLRHEIAHFEQRLLDLSVNSLWKERHAISKESEVIETLLNSGRYKKNEEEYLAHVLRHFSGVIENYRNGRRFNNHIKSLDSDSTSPRTQCLHSEDFTFGR